MPVKKAMFIQPFEINDYQMLATKYKAGNMKKIHEVEETDPVTTF